jgi:hypothetical protein
MDGQEPPAPRRVQPAERKPEVRVHKVIELKYAPAADVAGSITKLVQSERWWREAVTIAAAPVGNQLLVSTTPSLIEEVVELVEKLDRQPRSVVIEAVIAVVVQEDKTAGQSPLADFNEDTPGCHHGPVNGRGEKRSGRRAGWAEGGILQGNKRADYDRHSARGRSPGIRNRPRPAPGIRGRISNLVDRAGPHMVRSSPGTHSVGKLQPASLKVFRGSVFGVQERVART